MVVISPARTACASWPDRYGDTFQDFEPHNFYLDHISLLPEGSEYAVGKVPTAMELTGSETVKLGLCECRRPL